MVFLSQATENAGQRRSFPPLCGWGNVAALHGCDYDKCEKLSHLYRLFLQDFLMDFNPDIRLAMLELSLNPQLIAPGIINHLESMSIQAIWAIFTSYLLQFSFLSRL